MIQPIPTVLVGKYHNSHVDGPYSLSTAGERRHSVLKEDQFSGAH